MKIGLWLQDHRNDTEKRFNEVMNIVKKSDVDLIVLPEDAYIPFNHLLEEEEDYVFTTLGKWFSEADKLAKKIGKPMMLSARQDIYFENTKDLRPFIFSYYTNPQATENETINRVYFKNTMTGYSPLEFEDYENSILEQWNQYAPIFLKGKKIGMTICYDCTYPIFSALYGVQNVDIIINMTGGNVDYHKWYRYNQVRAIENECFSLVTMGYYEDDSINSYVFGFDPDGINMSFTNLMHSSINECNKVDSIYVYDTENYKEREGITQSEPTENKYQDLIVEAGNVSKLIDKAKQLREDYLYVLKKGDDNIIFVICDEEEVQVPELVAAMLYDQILNDIENKKYIIVNRRNNLEFDFLENQLDPLLRVRSMENFCAVILESPIANRVYQCSKNKKSQVLKEVKGKFGIDLSRTTGPEAIWSKSKNSVNVVRKDTYNTLIDICCEWASQTTSEEE